MFKIKSHLDDEGAGAISGGKVRIDHLIGNMFADSVADEASRLCMPDINCIKSAERSNMFGYTVAKRLAIIQAHAWRCKPDAYELPSLPAVNAVVQSSANASALLTLVRSGHRLMPTKQGFKCENCLLYRATSRFSFWGEHVCQPKALGPMLKRRICENRRKSASAQDSDAPALHVVGSSAHDSGALASSPHMRPRRNSTVVKTPAPICTLDDSDFDGNFSEGDCHAQCFDDCSDPGVASSCFSQDRACSVVDNNIDVNMSVPISTHDQDLIGTLPEEEAPPIGLTGNSSSSGQRLPSRANDEGGISTAPSVSLPCHAAVSRGRRLHGKQSAIGTPYEDVAPVGSLAGLQRRQAKKRCVDRTNRRTEQAVAAKALAVASKNVSRANELVDRFGVQVTVQATYSTIDQVHVSHDVKTVHNQPQAFFCDRCGAWSVGASLRSGLSSVCRGQVDQARKHQHRLLQCGVIPTPGARIPDNARKRKHCSDGSVPRKRTRPSS